MEEMPNEPGNMGNKKEKRQLAPFFFSYCVLGLPCSMHLRIVFQKEEIQLILNYFVIISTISSYCWNESRVAGTIDIVTGIS